MTAIPTDHHPRLVPIVTAPGTGEASPSVLAFPGRIGISPEEFAAATKTGRTLVYLALQRGEIPYRRIGRRIVIPLSALDVWFSGGDAA